MSGTPVIGGGKVGHVDALFVGLRLLKVTEKQSSWKSRGVVDVWFQRSRCLTMLFRMVWWRSRELAFRVKCWLVRRS